MVVGFFLTQMIIVLQDIKKYRTINPASKTPRIPITRTIGKQRNSLQSRLYEKRQIETENNFNRITGEMKKLQL